MRWLTAGAPAERLAVFRVLTGAFAVAYLTVRSPALLAMSGHDFTATFEPVGILWWLDAPLTTGAVRALFGTTVVLAVVYTVGAAFRVAGPLFAVTLLVLTTYHSSGGQLLWFENLLVLHVAIVSCSPAADALAWRPRGRDVSEPHDRYGFPLRLAAIVTVTTYALAGFAKLRIGGIRWMDGESLRNHVAYSAARARLLGGRLSPLAAPLVEHRWMFGPLAVATIVIEIGAPLCLLVRRARLAWAGAVWTMHAAIAATMFVVFPYPLSLVAMAPLFDLEHLVPGRRHAVDWRDGTTVHRRVADGGRGRGARRAASQGPARGALRRSAELAHHVALPREQPSR